jgi:hypothetical protein
MGPFEMLADGHTSTPPVYAMRALLQVRRLTEARLGGLGALEPAVRLSQSSTFNSSSSSSNTGSVGEEAGVTSLPADIWQATAPDGVLLPAEYQRVVAALKKRGEKGHMVLALVEVCWHLTMLTALDCVCMHGQLK